LGTFDSGGGSKSEKERKGVDRDTFIVTTGI